MKRTTLIFSITAILVCLVLVTGSTFSLFTSESEVNITVNSGDVSVFAAVDNVETWSLEDDKSAKGREDGSFTQGGSAVFDAASRELSITKIIPGDKVGFEITGRNDSTVTAKYCYKIACVGDTELMYGLVVTVNGNEYERFSSYTSEWIELAPGTDMTNVSVSIELPADATDEYEGLDTKILVSVDAVQGNAPTSGEEKVEILPAWNGTADTSWYNETDVEFTLSNAKEFAGLSELVDDGETFEGKTIMLDSDLDLDGGDVCFDPIGSYRKDTPFKGTFDGQGYTIKNMSQNTWALDNGYYYGDLGLGLFGSVEDATVKNVNIDNASISGESALCGVIAGAAYGDCTFENITVSNSECADYQYYAGGIVGWASGNHTYINCDVDASTKIAAQWGDFDNSIGGIIGGAGGSATIVFKDCDVACVIDAYNDVTSANRWYAYRRAGMLIGNTGKTVKAENGNTVAAAPQLTCENVTVTYGDWANYLYCEFSGMGYPYVRVQAGVSNSAYSNPRYGHPTDANGNEVVDDNHVHIEGEDHHILCEFNQLFGGGTGVYGDPDHDGVTVIYNNRTDN